MGHGDDESEDQNRAPSRRIRNSISEQELSVEVVKSERTVLELYRQYREGWLVLQARFQREFVWTLAQQSRLIESILARIPLPPIYLSEDVDGKMLVVDGQQRLTSLFRFLEGQFSLEDVELLPQLAGRRFEDLEPKLRRRFESTGLTVFLIQPNSDPHAALYLFERLNQGGTSLTAQERRNALLQGPALEIVRSMAGEAFRSVAGPQAQLRQAKADELVLRGLAFLAFGFETYSGDMPQFLDESLQRLNRMGTEDLTLIKNRYLRALGLVRDIFEGFAFRRLDRKLGVAKAHINASLMDIEVYGFDRVHEPPGTWTTYKREVRDAMTALHHDPAFADSISTASGSSRKVRYRFHQWLRVLQNVAHTDS